MHRFCGWLLRTKYYIKKGYDSIKHNGDGYFLKIE